MLSSDFDQSWTWLLKQDACKIFIINMKDIELNDFDNAKNNMLESGPGTAGRHKNENILKPCLSYRYDLPSS